MDVRPRLLFVDDEEDLREIVADFCASRRIEVIAVEDGLQATEALRAGAVDAVFSDLNVVGVSGVELLKQARRRMPGIPFLFWSGFLDPKILAQVKPHGNVDFLEKPFTFGDLQAALNRLLGQAPRK